MTTPTVILSARELAGCATAAERHAAMAMAITDSLDTDYDRFIHAHDEASLVEFAQDCIDRDGMHFGALRIEGGALLFETAPSTTDEREARFAARHLSATVIEHPCFYNGSRYSIRTASGRPLMAWPNTMIAEECSGAARDALSDCKLSDAAFPELLDAAFREGFPAASRRGCLFHATDNPHGDRAHVRQDAYGKAFAAGRRLRDGVIARAAFGWPPAA